MVVSTIFYVHPHLGKIPILTNIFQMGCNHQLVTDRQDHDENLGPRVQKAMDQFPSYSGEMPPPEASFSQVHRFGGEPPVLTCRKKVKLEELEIEIFSRVASLDVLYDVMAKRCTCDNM